METPKTPNDVWHAGTIHLPGHWFPHSNQLVLSSTWPEVWVNRCPSLHPVPQVVIDQMEFHPPRTVNSCGSCGYIKSTAFNRSGIRVTRPHRDMEDESTRFAPPQVTGTLLRLDIGSALLKGDCSPFSLLDGLPSCFDGQFTHSLRSSIACMVCGAARPCLDAAVAQCHMYTVSIHAFAVLTERKEVDLRVAVIVDPPPVRCSTGDIDKQTPHPDDAKTLDAILKTSRRASKSPGSNGVYLAVPQYKSAPLPRSMPSVVAGGVKYAIVPLVLSSQIRMDIPKIPAVVWLHSNGQASIDTPVKTIMSSSPRTAQIDMHKLLLMRNIIPLAMRLSRTGAVTLSTESNGGPYTMTGRVNPGTFERLLETGLCERHAQLMTVRMHHAISHLGLPDTLPAKTAAALSMYRATLIGVFETIYVGAVNSGVQFLLVLSMIGHSLDSFMHTLFDEFMPCEYETLAVSPVVVCARTSPLSYCEVRATAKRNILDSTRFPTEVAGLIMDYMPPTDFVESCSYERPREQRRKSVKCSFEDDVSTRRVIPNRPIPIRPRMRGCRATGTVIMGPHERYGTSYKLHEMIEKASHDREYIYFGNVLPHVTKYLLELKGLDPLDINWTHKAFTARRINDLLCYLQASLDAYDMLMAYSSPLACNYPLPKSRSLRIVIRQKDVSQ